MPELLIKSIDDLLAFNESYENENLVYRGQSNRIWGLTPSIYRGVDPGKLSLVSDSLSELERDLYREFGNKSAQYLERPGSAWDVLVAGQHHGAPTRLLDWTTVPLVAAYFAAAASPQCDGAVWFARPDALPLPPNLGRLHLGRGLRIEQIRRYCPDDELSFIAPVSKITAVNGPSATDTHPVTQLQQATLTNFSGFLTFLEAPFTNRRIQAQSGLFSVYVSTADNDVLLDQANYFRATIKTSGQTAFDRAIIPANTKQGILRSLDQLGVNSFSLFPDLEGLSRYLSRKHNESIARLG